MTFIEYYGDTFRSDLNQVVQNCPSPHAMKGDVIIQPKMLTLENHTINSWKPDRINLFATALFFTILADQVCYTYFRDFYSQFQALTHYPKFRGDCPGGCYYHLHPTSIFKVIGSSPGPASMWSGKLKMLDDAIETMRREVLNFFNTYVKSIDGDLFWEKCVAEFPKQKD